MDAVKAELDLSQAPRRVTVLGSTGSVGANTLDLLERNRDRYVVEALTANSNVALLAEQTRAQREAGFKKKTSPRRSSWPKTKKSNT